MLTVLHFAVQVYGTSVQQHTKEKLSIELNLHLAQKIPLTHNNEKKEDYITLTKEICNPAVKIFKNLLM